VIGVNAIIQASHRESPLRRCPIYSSGNKNRSKAEDTEPAVND
jgi:hypothetical protein